MFETNCILLWKFKKEVTYGGSSATRALQRWTNARRLSETWSCKRIARRSHWERCLCAPKGNSICWWRPLRLVGAQLEQSKIVITQVKITCLRNDREKLELLVVERWPIDPPTSGWLTESVARFRQFSKVFWPSGAWSLQIGYSLNAIHWMLSTGCYSFDANH